jgi:SAM-dependent methyltransferase
MTNPRNADVKTVDGFGFEWNRLDQASASLSSAERTQLFNRYFAIFPWQRLPANAEGFDLGCGSGRWAALVAPRVHRLHCIDPSTALDVARRNLSAFSNCVLHQTSVDAMPLSDGSMDFGYSLGVLHHVPDPEAGLRACVRLLKPRAPLLVYLYYAFDNRPWWFRALWRLSDSMRRLISRLPHAGKYWVSQVLAGVVYFPLARAARLLERLRLPIAHFPLSAYRHQSFYTMRTDALDRFGTRLEWRFTRAQIVDMMARAGLDDIQVSSEAPFWCAVGHRRP